MSRTRRIVVGSILVVILLLGACAWVGIVVLSRINDRVDDQVASITTALASQPTEAATMPPTSVIPTITEVPSEEPLPTPTATEEPTPKPTATAEPTATPSPTATVEPTAEPSPTATLEPTATFSPTATMEPTTAPTPLPTSTVEPTQEPTATTEPTKAPIIDSTSDSWYIDIGAGDEDYVTGFVDPPDTSHEGELGWDCDVEGRAPEGGPDYDFRNLAYGQEGYVYVGEVSPDRDVTIELCVANGSAPDDLDIYLDCGDHRILVHQVELAGAVGGPVVEEFTIYSTDRCETTIGLVFDNPTNDGVPQSGTWGLWVTVLLPE